MSGIDGEDVRLGGSWEIAVGGPVALRPRQSRHWPGWTVVVPLLPSNPCRNGADKALQVLFAVVAAHDRTASLNMTVRVLADRCAPLGLPKQGENPSRFDFGHPDGRRS